MSRQQNNSYDFIAKLLIIGDSGVGKTCLLLRFCENNFMMTHLTTIGIDFKIKTIDVDGKKIKMQIWDTAGQERFKTITQTYYKGAMGIILTYACNDRESFNSIANWMQQIKTHANEDVCKILVGNKSDLPDRQVTYEEGKKLADSYGIKFYETSAKDDLKVNDTFYAIAKEIKEKIITKDFATPGVTNNGDTAGNGGARKLNASQPDGGKKQAGCC
jgi:small GTP-binding protein